jgi:tetratricopeptide (TPR) repeat protein
MVEPIIDLSVSSMLIGRKVEASLLESALDRATQGEGIAISISGPAGIGKTSLMKGMEKTAAHRGFRIRSGYCLPDYSFPFFPFRQVFRQLPSETLEKSPGTRQRRSHKRGSILGDRAHRELPTSSASVFPRLARHEANFQRNVWATPPETEELLRYLTMLELETTGSPDLLFIDDFQWADPESVRALKILSRNIRHMRVLLVVALREDEVSDPGLLEVLRDLRREGLTQDIRLSGLSERDIRQLFENVVRVPIQTNSNSAFFSQLHERTGGNPYFVLEIARELKEGGYLHLEAEGFTLSLLPSHKGDSLPSLLVPKSVFDLLTVKLKALSTEEREVLEFAAMLGSEFDATPLTKLVPGARETGITRVLESLCTRRGVIVKSEAHPNYYAFSHGLLWEAVRLSMTPARRQRLALRIGSWWEAQYPADVNRIFTLYLESGNVKKVLTSVDKAVAVEIQVHSHERIADYMKTTLTFLKQARYPDTTIIDWGLSVISRLRKDGAGDQWIDALSQSLMELDVKGPQLWEVMMNHVLSSMLRGGEARKLFSKLKALVPSGLPGLSPTLDGKLCVVETILSYKEGKSEISRDHALRALTLLPESERYYRGLAYQYLGWYAAERSLWEEAHRYLEEVQRVLKFEPMLGLLMYVLNLKAAIMLAEGNLPGAESTQSDIVNIMKGVGHPGRLSISLLNLAMVRFLRRDIEGSEVPAREALRIAKAFSLPTPEGLAHIQLGLIHEGRGESLPAIKFYERALVCLEAGGDHSNLVDVHLNMAESWISLHDTDAARNHLAMVRRLESPRDDVKIQFHLIQARFAIEVGNSKQSRAEIEAALTESRNRRLRYYEGLSLLMFYRWTQRFGSPREVPSLQREAERVLSGCGVAIEQAGAGSRKAQPREPQSINSRRMPLSMNILTYLFDHGGVVGTLAPKDVAPLSLTQKGISAGLGIPQNRFSTVLQRLVHKGLVTAQCHYVRGMPRKLKAFFLTPEGLGVLGR